MEQLQETRRPQVTERNTEEELDVELLELDDSGFSVRLERRQFTAEAVQEGDDRKLKIDEEREEEEFSAEFVDQHYLDLIPDAWELVEEALEVLSVEVSSAASISLPAVAEEEAASPSTASGPSLPETGVDTSQEVEFSPSTAPDDPYDQSELEREIPDYNPGPEREQEPVIVAYPVPGERPYLQSEGESSNRVVEEQPYRMPEERQSHTEVRENAADVVEQLLQETELEGDLEQLGSYGLTEDFEGEAPEAYWVDIEGMDMDRTEYFINGELAEESIDQYELGPEDSITFVESDLFYSEEPEASSCTADLGLEEALPEAENVE
ncbi:MAG: hypothetical protein ABEJ66_02045, partial [Candidatus Nanohaloarchaea archaeon]